MKKNTPTKHASSGLLSLLALVCIAGSQAWAAVPSEVHYQGLLLDDQGAPVTATVALDFELFDAAVGGSSLWAESHPAVQVVDGVYDVTLGQTSPLTPALVAGGSLHLEITVEGETLTPRQPLLVVPYALRSAVSENALQVDGLDAAFVSEMLQHVNFDGQAPSNLDPREGLADPDGDGAANFVDPDNDNDGLPDQVEIAQGSDINLVTPTVSFPPPASADGFETSLVQVQGTNFEPGLAVVFGSETPTPMNLTSTSFEVLVGPQPEGTVNVSVTLPNGESATAPFEFFFLEPSISSFSPARFDQGQAGTITVTGQNFIAGMTVQFGSQSPVPSNVTPTSFDISVDGSEPPGFVSVTVTLPNGEQTTDDTGFEVSVGSPRVVFVTSTDHTGDLGGLAGADAICQGLADAAGLAGSFQAWLADSSDSPSTRASQAGAPYVRTDGTVVADDWTDLTDGDLDAPISLDEDGIGPGDPVLAHFVWSNVTALGAGIESTSHCSDWTSGASGGGRRGVWDATDPTWTELTTGSLCSSQERFYCVEQ